MKIGVKTYCNKIFLKHFDDKADFFEVMALEGKDYSFLREFSKPIIIHAQHQLLGVNNADKTQRTKNISSLQFAISLANQNKSAKIIVHPGNIINKNCSKEESISLINSFKDKRMLIENMPCPEEYLCTTPEEMSEYLKETGKGFCFDINHAISAALILKRDPFKMIKNFLKLKPSHYHLGGQKLTTNEEGQHLSFKDSKIDLDKIMKLIPKDAEITLETTTDIEKTEYDLDFIRKFTSK